MSTLAYTLELLHSSLYLLHAGRFVVIWTGLRSTPVQLMATHFVSCPLEPILTSTPSILVPLLTGMPSRHL